MSISKPTFQGYGTPVVYIYDRTGGVRIVDLKFSPGSTMYPIALEKFTFEFKEKEEDKCTIVISSSSLELMDDEMFYVGQTLKVAWGYLNGDVSPQWSMLVVDTRERFTTDGYQLTLELTDNFSALDKNVNPGIVVLQKKLESFDLLRTSLNKPNQVDNVDPITYQKKVEAWVKAKSGVEKVIAEYPMPPTRVSTISDEIVIAEAYDRFRNLKQKQEWQSGTPQDYMVGPVTEAAKAQYRRMALLNATSPGVMNALLSALGPDEDFDWCRVLDGDKGLMASLDPGHGNHIMITGHTPSTLFFNTLNKISESPKQITGRDGKVTTYDKRRAHASPPIASYTWKQEEGRFLEFTYDSNNKYSDDGSVLSQFTIDPETGAITRKDYIKEVQLPMMDPMENPYPTNDLQIIADATLADKLNMINQSGKSMEDWLTGKDGAGLPFAPGSHMGITKDGRLGGYIKTGIRGVEDPEQFAYGSEVTGPGGLSRRATSGKLLPYNPFLKGSTGDEALVENFTPAVDGIGRGACGVPVVSVPGSICQEDEESLENELKSLKQGDGESVKASAKVLGDPQLYSGVNVMLLGLGKKRSGKYFLTGVIHDINPGSGYICSLEGYLAATQATSIGTVKRTIKKETIKAKAVTIKADKIKVSHNHAEINKRGFYLPTDFYQTDLEAEMFKKDKDWLTRLPGTIYEVNILNKATGKRQMYKIKVPIDPMTGLTQYPYQVFGEDLFFNLAGQAGSELDNWIRKEGTVEWVGRTQYPHYK